MSYVSSEAARIRKGETMIEEKHYVTFLSPGTFMSEQTTKPIESWDPARAIALGEDVVERHDARPYGFVFETRLVSDPVPDGRGGHLRVESKLLERSGTHFLGGKLRTFDEVESLADPKEEILLSNMRSNEMSIVCEVRRGYKSTHPFGERDVVVDAVGRIVERGDDPARVAYRAERARRERERHGLP